MSHLTRYLTAVGVAMALLAVLVPTAALAHEKRAVGKYTFVVGFVNEPTIQNQPNGLDLTITDANAKPVEGAEKTLKVAVSYAGGTPKELELNASDENPGKYSASFIPTKAGSYSFSFSGSINGDPINATFHSGPNTFDDVISPTDLQFPVAVPAPADLAQQTQDANATAQAALQRATLFGAGGIAVGLIGIIVGVVALVTRTAAVASPDRETPVAKAKY
jgi:hypothetical protein